ncbi:MAG: hypothetical protein GXP36_04900 [Actinobacteria bacterium]|nr:hypothetical protein [Actinomycetota bacterium]
MNSFYHAIVGGDLSVESFGVGDEEAILALDPQELTVLQQSHRTRIRNGYLTFSGAHLILGGLR